MTAQAVTHRLVAETRTVSRTYEVTGIAPVPSSAGSKILYTPTHVRVEIHNGSTYVKVVGTRVLKSGGAGASNHTIHSLSYLRESARPEWLADIVAETVRAAA